MAESFVIQCVSQALKAMGLPVPKDPLFTVVQTKDFNTTQDFTGIEIIYYHYQITLEQLACGWLFGIKYLK